MSQQCSDRFDEVALEDGVSTCFVRSGQRDNVGESLTLMDDSVGVGQVLPVLSLHQATSHHIVELLLDLIWMQVKQEFNGMLECCCVKMIY